MKKSGLGGLAKLLIGLGGVVLALRILPILFKGFFAFLAAGLALFAALIIVVIVLALKGSNSEAKEKEKNGQTVPGSEKADVSSADSPAAAGPALTPEQAAVLAKGRANLTELRKLIVRIKRSDIHVQGNEICDVIEKILKTLREKPDQIQDVRQFFNYYLPTLGEILTKYANLEKSGVSYGETADKVSEYLKDICKAMDKQYENLFEDDKLDLSVDMEAMAMAFRRDGLIADGEVAVGEDGQNITLTL